VPDDKARQTVLRYAENSGRSEKSEPEIVGRHDNTSDAKMKTACDWPLNVTWIFQQYYNVSELQCAILPTPTVVAVVEFSAAFVCLSVRLSVCLFFSRTISQKSLQLGSPILTQKCSTMSPENPFILGLKGQRSRSRGTKTVLV